MISGLRISARQSLWKTRRFFTNPPKHDRFHGTISGANLTIKRTMNRKHNMETAVLPVDIRKAGRFSASPKKDDILDELSIELDTSNDPGAEHLRSAAEALRTSDIPIAFPTETVYGLGADATRSAAVNGIYKAKQRPADNPLIVHFASLRQLRELLRPSATPAQANGHLPNGVGHDPIPAIYKPLISKFWPGPLTLILPNPPNSPLAPEVTAGLDTFGARMPRHPLALALITSADKPIAAPSANASTKPSPTAAEHVVYDLSGRIEMILDGGPCDVGVESTVVTGLSDPPRILRPGGISLEQIRSCPGWGATEIGYKNVAEADVQPSAPGMKYRHYSPKATVVLHEAGRAPPGVQQFRNVLAEAGKVGIITTKCWRVCDDFTEKSSIVRSLENRDLKVRQDGIEDAHGRGFAGMLETLQKTPDARKVLQVHDIDDGVDAGGPPYQLLEIPLGSNVADIARGIFSALRELDRSGVDAIFVEGIDDNEGDMAAAVMNRLRKAAEIKVAGGEGGIGI